MRHIWLVFGALLFSGCISAKKTEQPSVRPVQSEIFGPLKALEPGVVAGDALPIVTRQVQPTYQNRAAGKKMGGEAVIEFIVEIDGTVHFTRVVSQSDEEFGAAAAACVKQWRFKPGLKAGVPVRCAVIVPIKVTPE